MKNYIILFCLALFFGCEKIPSGIVENSESNYQVLDASAPAGFTYSKGDSTFTVALKLSSTGDVKNVWADIYNPDEKKLNSEAISLKDDGIAASGDVKKNDSVYTAKIAFSQSYPNGRYRIEYFVLSTDGITRKAAESRLVFDNNQMPNPPVLSDLVMPDSIKAGDFFIFTVRVSDPNGLNDVKRVSFKFIRKEDSTSSDNIDMWDDGNFDIHGDSVAGDGVYSFKNRFTPETQGKVREFDFQAEDRSSLLSNIITHNIYVK